MRDGNPLTEVARSAAALEAPHRRWLLEELRREERRPPVVRLGAPSVRHAPG